MRPSISRDSNKIGNGGSRLGRDRAAKSNAGGTIHWNMLFSSHYSFFHSFHPSPLSSLFLSVRHRRLRSILTITLLLHYLLFFPSFTRTKLGDWFKPDCNCGTFGSGRQSVAKKGCGDHAIKARKIRHRQREIYSTP